MADRVLRDHSEPCEHKTDYPDGFTTMVPYYCGHWIKGEGEWCPGGREVTIDYEAAGRQLAEALQRWGTRLSDETFHIDEWADEIVEVALGGV